MNTPDNHPTNPNNAGCSPCTPEAHQQAGVQPQGRKYLTCAETAKLVRQALKEAFPRFKFSVTSSTYSGGASMRVRWTDGPNAAQVEAITERFAGAYFDGSIDYKGSIYHMMQGQQVRFGADFIFCEREYSDAAVETAIGRVYRAKLGNFERDGIARPTVEEFRRGALYSVQLSGLHYNGMQSVQSEIHEMLAKASDRAKVEHSPTAAGVFVTHDDGYSRSSGAGFSAVDPDQ